MCPSPLIRPASTMGGKVNTNPVLTSSPQGMHTIPNELHGIGTAGIIGLAILGFVALVFFFVLVAKIIRTPA